MESSLIHEATRHGCAGHSRVYVQQRNGSKVGVHAVEEQQLRKGSSRSSSSSCRAG